MSRQALLALTLALLLTLPASATSCDGAALLTNNTPLGSMCPSYGLPNAGLAIPLAMQKDSANVAMITAAANQQGVPPQLALAVAYSESQFASCAGSPTGVKGPMQLTQATAKSLGYNRDINEQNIKGGMAVLKTAINSCGTSDIACLASRYNGASSAEQAGWASHVTQSLATINNMKPSEFPTDCVVCAPGSVIPTPGTPTVPPTPPSPQHAFNVQQYLGQYQGVNQQCASLTKALVPGVGAASGWQQGDLVQGNASIQPGTAIATFNYGGNYGPDGSLGGISGGSHTGIYLGQDGNGVQLLNQWDNQNGSGGAIVSTIPWSSWNGNALEGGAKYYTIKGQ